MALKKYEPRKSQTSTVNEAMEELLQTYKLKSKYEQTQIVNSWEQLMGAPIAKRTEKVYIREKKLFIKLNSAALKHELSYCKSKIIALLNREMNSEVIEEVIFL